MTSKTIPLTETARLLRETLKIEFPGVKFSVRSKSYSGGASIRCEWVDGPTSASVKAVASFYEGASFDGMIDLKSYTYHTNEGGETVHYGADYVFTDRDYSDRLTDAVAAVVAQFEGLPKPELNANHWYDWQSETCQKQLEAYCPSSLADKIREARQHAVFNGDTLVFVEPPGGFLPQWVDLMQEMMQDGRLWQLKVRTPEPPPPAEPDGWDLSAPWFNP